MIYYTDPLNGGNVAVTDVASAAYALKLANDDYFGVYYQGQEMLKELSRLSGEIFNQKYELIEPYLPQDTDTSSSSSTNVKPKIIPNPLPRNVPQSVKDALNYLDEQYNLEEERLQAELAENTVESKATIARLEEKVATWFKNQVLNNVNWLGGKRSVTFSGCTLTYSGGNVSFSYAEMPYD